MAIVKHVTCISVGMYNHAISKGNVYEVVEFNNDNYRIKGNHGKLVYINKLHFVEGIIEIPILTSWSFDDDIENVNFVDVSFTFSNGSKRWAIVTTPIKLQNHFEGNVYPPGFNTHHLIVIRSFNDQDVEATFRALDLQGELEAATLPLI